MPMSWGRSFSCLTGQLIDLCFLKLRLRSQRSEVRLKIKGWMCPEGRQGLWRQDTGRKEHHSSEACRHPLQSLGALRPVERFLVSPLGHEWFPWTCSRWHMVGPAWQPHPAAKGASALLALPWDQGSGSPSFLAWCKLQDHHLIPWPHVTAILDFLSVCRWELTVGWINLIFLKKNIISHTWILWSKFIPIRLEDG